MNTHAHQEDKFKYYFTKGFKIFFMVIFFLLFGGFATMYLWNALIPAIFGLTAITFWQAIGLIVLSKIFFSGMGTGGGGRGHRSHKMHCGEHWSSMSAEDKTAMRDKMRSRFESHLEDTSDDHERNAND